MNKKLLNFIYIRSKFWSGFLYKNKLCQLDFIKILNYKLVKHIYKGGGKMLPQKLIIRRILENSGLKLNRQIWLPAKNCLKNLYEIINEQTVNWPNLVISTALVKENEAGGSPLTKPERSEIYRDKKFLTKTLADLEVRCKEYNGIGFCENDWLRLFSSPLGINHLLVGLSIHFDVHTFIYGDDNHRPIFMPFIVEAQQGTWPRYFNVLKSEETRKSFTTVFIGRPYIFWEQAVIKGNPDGIVARAISEAISYFLSANTMLKVFCLAQEMKFRWIGFDAQYIAENDEGHQEYFKIYDFCGF